jgi:hypothetical protein
MNFMRRKIYHLIFALFISSTAAFGREADTYVFNFKSGLEDAIFKLTDDEKKELINDVKADIAAAPANMPSYAAEGEDAIEQFGNLCKYRNVPTRLPMFGQSGTNWVLCCRTTSLAAIGVYQENLGHGVEYDYCLVSQEYLDASKANGRITLYGEDVPVSELRPVATLLAGMKEILWRNEIESEANSLNIINLADFQSRAQMQGRTFNSRNSTDWIHLAANSETTELVKWLPAAQSSAGSNVAVTNLTKDTASFREMQFGMIDASTLSKIQEKNNTSENDFVQFTNDIYQCVQLDKGDAELQKQADAKRAEDEKENEKQLAEQKKVEAQQAADEQKHEQELFAGVKTKTSGKPRGGLTVKGFFIGQNISQAVDLYNSKYSANNSATLPIQLAINPLGGFVTTAVPNTNTTDLTTLATQLNGGSVIFSAGDDGQINQIVITAAASDVFFGTTGMSTENFVQKFNDGYNLGTFQSSTDANGNTVWTLESDKGIRVIIQDKAVEIDSIASAGDTKFN